MKRLRVGIIGQGRSGHDIHVEWLRQNPEKFAIAAEEAQRQNPDLS